MSPELEECNNPPVDMKLRGVSTFHESGASMMKTTLKKGNR